MHFPKYKELLIRNIAESLQTISGVEAIVLGGSFARSTARPDSDLDIGIYYFEDQPLDIDSIRKRAKKISLPDKPPTVTGLYEWGPWVNGGAWIHTENGKVDFLYRNVDQLRRTIADSQNGISHHDFHQQPTFGFTSLIYLAETTCCIPLFDKSNLLPELKSSVAVYPKKLQSKVIRDSLWSAEFTLVHANGFAERGDVFNTAGCLGKVAFYFVQILFALNEQYYFGDKGALDAIDQFSKRPETFRTRIESVLAYPGQNPEQLSVSVQAFGDLWRIVQKLTANT
jgi:hypothetical protein